MSEKVCWDTLQQTCVFASGEICVLGSALSYARGVKRRCTIFLARVGPVRIPQKFVGTPDTEFLFLHPVVSTGHVAHFGTSMARNIDTIFLMLRWDRCSFHKNCVRTSYVELVLLHPMGYAGRVVHYGASGARNVDALFFMLVCDQYGFHKKRTQYAKLVFCIQWGLWLT
jgi:hypothetical protein